MDNKHIAEVLQEISEFLEIKGENPFKVRAFSNGARIIDSLGEDVGELVKTGTLRDIKGIGAGLSEVIESLVKTGKSEYYDELKHSFPADFLDILKIPSVGPKRAKILYEKLNIKSVAELEYACQENHLLTLDGFGEKSQAKILEAIKHHNQTKDYFLISQAAEEGEKFVSYLKRCKEIVRIEIGGSLRRHKEVVHDIDILVGTKKPAPIHEAFARYPDAGQVLAKGETKSSLVLKCGMQVDLRTVSEREFSYALYYFTGSKEHNVSVRTAAKRLGYKINEYGVFKNEKLISCRDETDIFKIFKLDYIPPEMRENTGEIEAAAEHKIPNLVSEKDIRGVFHVHTTDSDGVHSLEQMVSAAAKLGYEYIGISDHSKSAPYANGLSAERVKKQREDIDRLQKKFKNIRIFHGIESDILADGSLDYSDKVLSEFDFVIGSIHSRFSMSEKEMTDRISKAMANPHMTFLGHSTGRLLLGRAGYDLDFETIFETAAKHDVIIEINAHPARLDLDWRHHRAAKAKGVRFSINPDAHSTDGFNDIKFGVGIARKGWLVKSDILNTFSANEVEKFLKERCVSK